MLTLAHNLANAGGLFAAMARGHDEDGREARNALAVELRRIDGEHSSSLVDCAKRAAELLRQIEPPEYGEGWQGFP